MHARKTRERKKQQSNALQTRLNELENEVTVGQANAKARK
jgi:Basic region leucine zipper